MLSSANALNLDQSKILLFGKELIKRFRVKENASKKKPNPDNQHFSFSQNDISCPNAISVSEM